MGKVVPFKNRKSLEEEQRQSSTLSENRFDSEAQQIYSSADTTFNEGRLCVNCGQWKVWKDFNKKPMGLNGHDSRCKPCISISKARSYRVKAKKLERERSVSALFTCNTEGLLDKNSIENFGSYFAAGIRGLIEDGKL